MEANDLSTLLLYGGGFGAVWALARWYLKERMQQELDERTRRHELQQRRDELRMRKFEHEQEAMNQVFTRFSTLSDRMAALIFELALDRSGGRSEGGVTGHLEDGSTERPSVRAGLDLDPGPQGSARHVRR